jgi:hypothetical protein
MGSPQLRGRLENFKTIATFHFYPALTMLTGLPHPMTIKDATPL